MKGENNNGPFMISEALMVETADISFLDFTPKILTYIAFQLPLFRK